MAVTDVEVAAVAGPRTWLILGVATLAAITIVTDQRLVNVAIPAVMRELDAPLSSVQWMVTGSSLIVASLLIIGGRLGDVFGRRRTFVLGAALIALGSLLGSLAWDVGGLIIGKAVVQGVGTSLMLPASLAVVSTTFTGRARATAFGAWAATVGTASALGPLLGGWLTTALSWRWAFGIGAIAPMLAIVGALAWLPRASSRAKAPSLDVGGAGLLATGMFLLVFALSEGDSYGWLLPTRPLEVGGAQLWPAGAPLSVIPPAVALAGLVFFAFFRWERHRVDSGEEAMFDFGLLRVASFRFGLIATAIAAGAQAAMMLALALFVQDGKQLSAYDNGIWLLPVGLAMLATAPLAAVLVGRFGAVGVARGGLCLQAIGLTVLALRTVATSSLIDVAPGLIAYGAGVGLATSQLTSVIMGEVAGAKAGVAAGSNSSVRQAGSAVGVAVSGSSIIASSSVVTGARSAMVAAAVMVVLALIAALRLPRHSACPP